MTAAASIRPGLFDVFRSRDYRFFQLAALVSTISLQVQSVSVGWQVYALTRRTLDLGYVGLAQFLPSLAMSLVTGHVADRFDRRTVLLWSHAVLALSSAFLWAWSRDPHPSVGWIYIVLLLVGACRAFQGPAAQALMPNLVAPEHLESAVAWSSSSWHLAVIVGPALGGLLYSAAGASTVYFTSASLALGALAFTTLVRAHAIVARTAEPSVRAFVAGLRYVATRPILLGAISLDLFAVLFGGATALLPVYARDILHVGPDGLGVLRGAPAVGAILVGIRLAWRPLGRRAGPTMLICVAIFGLMTIVFGLSRQYALSCAALAVAGAADMVSVYIRQTLIQANTPDAMRGRVAAVNMIFVGASNELGEFESGATAQWFGVVPAVVLGGIGTCVVVLAWALLFPPLRRVDRLTPSSAESG